MRAIIVDDEILVAKNLSLLLKRFCPEVIIEGKAQSASAAKKLIEEKTPDIVFLDVEMPHSNGFDLLKSFNQINFGVIFVTAFDHYAIHAIKYSAIDYLLKPIDVNELVTAVKKAQIRLSSNTTDPHLNVLMQNLAQPDKRLQKLSLTSMEGTIFVDLDDIIYCKSEGNYTSFFMRDGQTHLITKQIGIYEELLPEPFFCRIHRQYIVNVNKVSKYMKGRGGYVEMSDGKTIDVSVRKKDDFLNAYSLK